MRVTNWSNALLSMVFTVKNLLRKIVPKPLHDDLRRARDRIRFRKIGVRMPAPSKEIKYCGTEYGGYAVPTTLANGQAALCFGAGEDISFEISLAEEFGMHVHIFDPTPRAAVYCERVIESERGRLTSGSLNFHEYGVWSESGKQKFYVPQEKEHVSHSILNIQNTAQFFEAECLTPTDLLDYLSVEDVALVKLNIEGAEYEVIKSMFECQLLPTIICIAFDELHTQVDDGANQRLKGLVAKFIDAGYSPIDARDSKVTFRRD